VVDRITTDLSFGNTWGRQTSLFARGSEGCLYAAGGGALLRIDPDAGTTEVLVDDDVHHAALGGNDRIYVAGEIKVYRLEEYGVSRPLLVRNSGAPPACGGVSARHSSLTSSA